METDYEQIKERAYELVADMSSSLPPPPTVSTSEPCNSVSDSIHRLL
jgi:hypothetical protein